MNYGFAPLIGVNFTFKEFLKGSLGANFKYNTTMSYDLATSSRNIIETLTRGDLVDAPRSTAAGSRSPSSASR